MTRHAWLIPIDPAPAVLRATLSVLHDRAITYTVLSPHGVREQLDQDQPAASVVHGGVVSPELFDVQRWLAEFHVPTLVLVEALTDYYEATLLDRGARDVVGLPASTRKLRSRVDALVRPEHHGPLLSDPPGEAVTIADLLEIHPRERTVEVGSQPVKLTRSEFDLLLALVQAQGSVLERQELAKAVGRVHLSDRSLESHISRIRLKLRAAGAPDCIGSVRSVGYRLEATP